MSASRKNKRFWQSYSDDELLDLRFCDLKLKISDTLLQDRIELLYDELKSRGIRFKPHCWLSEEWFSPDGVPGIAIPFYLAHPRLAKLEYRQMFEVEGGNTHWCMQLLRHEAGHAINTAYSLHRRKRWRQLFGSFTRPYPTHYIPNPKSKNYVFHLDWWYAQSHPAEDFAETFAVWLKQRKKWQKTYAGWPAMKKLEYMDELMASISRKPALKKSRERVEPLSTNKKTLREHYEDKRDLYGINVPEVYDSELLRLFQRKPEENGMRRTASAFLRKHRTALSQLCARGIGEPPYIIAQVINDMIIRCRELKLYVTRPDEEMKIELAIFLSVQTLNYFNKARHRVAI